MSGQTDLFTFGPFGKKPLREQVTPHKISLLILIYEYCELKKNASQILFVGFGANPIQDEDEKLTEREKRDFMTIILKLLQSPDLPLKDLIEQIHTMLKPKLFDDFTDRLKEFYDEGVLPLMDFFQELSKMLTEPSSSEAVISGSSVLGLFLRRMILAFDKLSFSQVTKLYSHYKDYYEDVNVPPMAEESENFGGSLIDSITSQTGGGRLTKSGLTKALDQSHLEGLKSSADGIGGFYSHKQAEYFISRQGFLLQHNENEAMSASELQAKITNMLQSNPDLSEAHFLSFLNNLRVKEYCTALHNLFHYFDRNTHFTAEGSQSNKNREEDISRRYAALNLASLHFRFGHGEEALAALQEAIRMAQETNDHVCLQHALSWLHRIEESGTARTASLMARSVLKSEELSLPNITSLGVQALAKHNAFATAKPCSVFEYLLKSDILNCQHSQSHFMCVSYIQKAALWNMYGKRESGSMCSQLVLSLDTSEGGIYHSGEAVCIALCNMAKVFANNGHYAVALEIINSAKQRFPAHTQHAHLWMICELEILFDRTLLNLRWGVTEQSVQNLRAFDEDEAELWSAILNKEKGEVTKTLSVLNNLLEKVQQNQSRYTPDFTCRILLMLAELYIQTGNHTSAVSHILTCLTWAKDHHLQYIVAMATVHLAFVQFQMELPQQALLLLDQHMITILSHGSVYDKARTLYCYARCKVATGSKLSERDKKSALLLAVNLMSTVIDLFTKIEAHQRVKDATYYLARLYHDLNYTSERNKCAYQFKQLDQQYPTLNKVSVLRM